MKLEDKLALIAEARLLGATAITIENIKYDIGPEIKEKIIEPISDQDAKSLIMPASIFDEMTEEEVLFYHSPYYDELQQKKKLQLEHKENEAVNG